MRECAVIFPTVQQVLVLNVRGIFVSYSLILEHCN